MHLVESFALNTGLEIDKPYTYEKFIPLPFTEDYITLQPYGKFESRKYDYWDEVTDILLPTLKKENIKIIQLGLPNEKDIYGCFDMKGRTDFNQTAYLIKNSVLHLGIDSFGIHFASGYGKKLVGLYCNMLPSQSGPYWSNKDDTIILQPQRSEGEKPSYSPVESVKSINKIKPEDIAKSVCELLGIDFDFPYRTVRVGNEYHSRKIELIPATYIENNEELGVDSIIVRMDNYFNEAALQKQMQKCKVSIVTDKPINLNIIKQFKHRINEFVFFIDEDTDPNYLKLLKKTGVTLYFLTKMSEEEHQSVKLKLLDVGGISRKPKLCIEDIKELKGKDLSKIYYKTSCFSVFKDDIYTSSVFSKKNDPVLKVRNLAPSPVIDDPDFWDQAENYILLEKIE